MKGLITAATNADRATVVNFLNSLQLPTTDLPQTLENFKIIKIGNQVMGVCGLELYGTVALLRSLAVAPGSQQQGLGGILLEATLESAKEKEVQHVYLITNTAAAFFTKRNFTPVERTLVPAVIQSTAQFSSVCPVSATVMYRQVH